MKSRSLLFGICLLSTLIFSLPAVAAHTATAFSLFHVLRPIDGVSTPYECLKEDWGAVYNNCGYDLALAFTLPIDKAKAAAHTVKVQNYVKGFGTSGATCYLWSYDGDGNGQEGTVATFNANGAQTLTFKSAVFGNSISLLCDVPSGAGIGAINWTP